MGHVRDLWHKKGPDGTLERTTYYGKGKRWQARWINALGEPKTATFAKKIEADRELTKQEAAALQGDWLDPEAGKVSVGTFALETWLPAQSIIGRTEKEYRGVLNRYLLPEWGRRQIRSIKPSEASAWQALLVSKYELTGTYPNKVARHIRSVFKLAVMDHVIRVSPFDKIKAPTLVESTVDPPDVAEARRIIDHAYTPLWQVLFEINALTGLRSGELRGMRVGKIDFLRKAYRVDEQLVYEAGKGLFLDDLKTPSAKRVLPLNQRAIDLLAEYIAKYPPPSEGQWQDLVFTMPDGRPIGESTVDWALKATCRKAKVRARRMHEWRHHYASILIAGNENPKVVQRRLGHKDFATTMRIYAHLFAEAEEQTRSVLDAAWAVPSNAEKTGKAKVLKIT